MKHYAYVRNHGIPERKIRKPRALRLSQSWKMWLAAVIDCEGWIGLTQNGRGPSPKFYGGVGVGNTNHVLTDKLLSLTGLGYCGNRKRPAPAKDVIHWVVTKRNEVDDLLATIRPYLILKKRQADLLLSLPPLHTRDNAARASIKAQITILNRRGKD